MKLRNYLKEHTIVSIGNLVMDKCVIVEVIVDNPEELIRKTIENNCYICEIRWWDRTQINKKSEIGYGGTRDPRNPQNYYFAETDICCIFSKNTEIREYINYINSIKEQYYMYDLYPAFDIYEK